MHPDLNKLFCSPSVEGKETVTVKFGLYINWGSPNRNPSRIQNVATALQELGYGVQFSFDNSGASHYVALCTAEGREVCRNEDLQHNRNYSKNKANSDALVEEYVRGKAAA